MATETQIGDARLIELERRGVSATEPWKPADEYGDRRLQDKATAYVTFGRAPELPRILATWTYWNPTWARQPVGNAPSRFDLHLHRYPEPPANQQAHLDGFISPGPSKAGHWIVPAGVRLADDRQEIDRWIREHSGKPRSGEDRKVSTKSKEGDHEHPRYDDATEQWLRDHHDDLPSEELEEREELDEQKRGEKRWENKEEGGHHESDPNADVHYDEYSNVKPWRPKGESAGPVLLTLHRQPKVNELRSLSSLGIDVNGNGSVIDSLFDDDDRLADSDGGYVVESLTDDISLGPYHPTYFKTGTEIANRSPEKVVIKCAKCSVELERIIREPKDKDWTCPDCDSDKAPDEIEHARAVSFETDESLETDESDELTDESFEMDESDESLELDESDESLETDETDASLKTYEESKRETTRAAVDPSIEKARLRFIYNGRHVKGTIDANRRWTTSEEGKAIIQFIETSPKAHLDAKMFAEALSAAYRSEKPLSQAERTARSERKKVLDEWASGECPDGMCPAGECGAPDLNIIERNWIHVYNKHPEIAELLTGSWYVIVRLHGEPGLVPLIWKDADIEKLRHLSPADADRFKKKAFKDAQLRKEQKLLRQHRYANDRELKPAEVKRIHREVAKAFKEAEPEIMHIIEMPHRPITIG
jgi:hypothetical protein